MGRYSGKTCRLLTMLSMTASFFLVEIIVGYVTNSIALVADSFHMLSDVVALVVGFASVRISKWRTKRNTFGWVRAEVLGALVNSVFLIALCFSIMVEALKRLVEVEKIQNPKLLLVVGGAGLLVNLVGLVLFHNHGHSHGGHGGEEAQGNQDRKQEEEGLVEKQSPATNGSVAIKCEEEGDSHRNLDIESVVVEFDEKRVSSSAQLNMRAVFLHVLGDALGSIIVIISALVIWLVDKDWVYYIDPAMSIGMVLIILSTTIPLLKESALVLLQTVPTHIRVNAIQTKIEKVTGVLNIHEFHIWQLAGNRIVASAHVRCRNPVEYMTIASKLKDIFHQEGIHSTTIQPEFEDNIDWISPRDCLLECGPDKNCFTKTCCGVPKLKSDEGTDEDSPSRTRKRVSNSDTIPDTSDTVRLPLEELSIRQSDPVKQI